MTQSTTEKSSSSKITIITSSSSGSTGRIQYTSSKTNSVFNWQNLLRLGNLVYYQLVAIVAVLIFWPTFEKGALNNVFTWHILLCAGAYMPLMAVAIIAFSTDNLLTLNMRREHIYWVHGILLSISCLFVTVGISLETHNKTKGGSKHFKSNHAILGLVSWILVLISVFMGLAGANARTFGKFVRPIVTKFCHNFLGISAFVLGVAALMLEYTHFKRSLSASVYQGLFWASIYIAVWSLLAALKSLFFQAKGIVT